MSKKLGSLSLNGIKLNLIIGTHGNQKTAPPIQPIYPKNWPNWRCRLVCSSKTISIVLGAECSFYVKSIATYAPQCFGYNYSVLAIVCSMKLPDTEAAVPDEVGVIRPPPTAELKPMRDGLPLPGAREL